MFFEAQCIVKVYVNKYNQNSYNMNIILIKLKRITIYTFVKPPLAIARAA